MQLPHYLSCILRKTNVSAYVTRCEKLLNSQKDAIALHAIGHAINHALTVALTIEERLCGSVKAHIVTSTIEVTDDLVPLLDGLELESKKRSISAVHICLQRASF
uniref:Alba domain-containing protein n=1 Tax=Steinernema glaseri TaxID=37863 RepID=A0A1I7YDV4_9BILA